MAMRTEDEFSGGGGGRAEAPPDGYEWKLINGEWQLVPIAAPTEPEIAAPVVPEPEIVPDVVPEQRVAAEENPYLTPETAAPSTVTQSAGQVNPYVDPYAQYVRQDNGGVTYSPEIQRLENANTGRKLGVSTGGPDAGPVGGGGAAGSDSGLLANDFGMFRGPAYTPVEQFKGPDPFQYDPFAYEQFRAPTLADAQNEPGYDFAKREGERALQNSRAARGTVRTGSALKDLLKWGNAFAEQNYGNVYARTADSYDRNRANAYGSWDANRRNAADAYVTNYGVGRDVWDRNSALNETTYDRNYKSGYDTFASNREGQKFTLDDAYRRWAAELEAKLNLMTAPIPGE